MQNGQVTYQVNRPISEEEYLLLQKENTELSEKVTTLTAELLYYKQELA